MIFPYRIETLFKHYPWANWVLVALMVLFHFSPGAWYDEDAIYAMVLQDWSVAGLLGHQFLHAGLMHLIGNMVVLWVFGNAVCGNTSNWVYLPLFLALGAASGSIHLLVDGSPVVGASGAVNGITGMALAMYPLNRVSVAWWFWFRFGSFTVPLWVVALAWFVMDAIGALLRSGNIAHVAHLGGLACGLAAGWLALRLGWVELTEFDNSSLEDIFAGRSADDRRKKIREHEAAERAERGEGPVSEAGGPWARQAAATGDPLVMPATALMVEGWTRRASETEVSAADAARIQAGGADGARRHFELLYAASFAAMGYSFHRSLADYFRRVGQERIWPHEGPALANLLRMIEEDFEAMRVCGFVEDDLAAHRNEQKLAAFLRAGVATGVNSGAPR